MRDADRNDWDHAHIGELIDLALREDIGSGDATTEACVPPETRASGVFLSREALILAGTPLLKRLYGGCRVELLASDGDSLGEDQVFARVEGPCRQLLTVERTALNLLQRASGIATLTSRFVREIEGTGCTLLDTRKTSPGMRMVAKLAVLAGGGTNHRMGLYDAILVKNNHITVAGGVRQAIGLCRPSRLPVEVEVRSLDELAEALDCGCRHVLLDNFSPSQVAVAVRRVGGRAKVEVSGNVVLETLRDYAMAGADYVSVGALTHSARAMDISFRIR
ncbi:MAG: carboxylating nicotinate-nucleotide diphosphorylase [Bryobacterales bacterium]|nr:carboxylating nicotinate-nucleotide diphosphorylase [Bryobacterales bacterium]